MPGKALPHEDAPQVGMPGEAQAVHVPDLALLQVGAGEDAGQAGYDGIGPVGRHLHGHLTAALHAAEVVHRLEAVRPVHAGQVA